MRTFWRSSKVPDPAAASEVLIGEAVISVDHSPSEWSDSAGLTYLECTCGWTSSANAEASVAAKEFAAHAKSVRQR